MIELFDATGKTLAKGTIVPDGGRIRVSTLMMDSAAPDIAAITRAAMADSGTQARPVAAPMMHRPGTIALADGDRAAREKALDARDKRLGDAWKNPQAVQAAVADVTTPNSAWQKKQARLAQAWKNGAQ